jgi:hypothetical protein
MEAGKQRRLADVFITITDPRQAAKVEHDLVELLVVAVNAVLVLWRRIPVLPRLLRLPQARCRYGGGRLLAIAERLQAVDQPRAEAGAQVFAQREMGRRLVGSGQQHAGGHFQAVEMVEQGDLP